MNATHLADMANDIAAYFQAEPDHATAVKGMVAHLQNFWEPRMRLQIVQYARSEENELVPLAQDAVRALAARLDQKNAPPKPDGGGDGG